MKENLMQDETGRKVTPEQLLRENARLRGDLRTMATRINHDLRTPLGGIITTAELLKETLATKHSDALPLAGSLFTSADELAKLFSQLRFLTKAAADPKPKERVNMEMIVLGALAVVESRALKRRATITQPGAWPAVEGVPDWLEFIWVNLLTNALQHAGEQPQIKLGWFKEKQGFNFQVSDNGGGVPPEMRAKLFQPFDSLHQLGSTRGLGLSIVQRLVDLQGGQCGYAPNPPGGACFYFTLPS